MLSSKIKIALNENLYIILSGKIFSLLYMVMWIISEWTVKLGLHKKEKCRPFTQEKLKISEKQVNS